jgi:hypothetical protein
MIIIWMVDGRRFYMNMIPNESEIGKSDQSYEGSMAEDPGRPCGRCQWPVGSLNPNSRNQEKAKAHNKTTRLLISNMEQIAY